MRQEEWERLLYQELSEDVRHFGTMLWEIPTAIFLVDSFLLTVASTLSLCLVGRRVVIGFGLLFTAILTWRLFKVVKRTENRTKELRRIEGKRSLGRYREKEEWYLQAPLGYSMIGLLALFVCFLIFLFFYPQLIASNSSIAT